MGAVEHLKTIASALRCQPWRAAGNGRKLFDAANDNALVTSGTRQHDLESKLSYRPVGICQVNNYVDGSKLLSLGIRVVFIYIRHSPDERYVGAEIAALDRFLAILTGRLGTPALTSR
jgi:hypothetical protein